MNIEQDFVFVPIENGTFHYKLTIHKYDYVTNTYKKEYYSGIGSRYTLENNNYNHLTLKIDKLFISFTCTPENTELIRDHIFNQLTKKKSSSEKIENDWGEAAPIED